MRDAFAVSLDVELKFFVFLDDVLFDVLDIDACVFNGHRSLAPGDFNRQAAWLLALRRSLRGRRRRILSGDANRGRGEQQQGEAW